MPALPAPSADLAALAPVVDAYRTCALATVSPRGTPTTWPAVTLLRPDGTFVLTTSVAFSRKAENLRRDPRVGLLFSDPTGSGLADPPHVLVQGTATVSEGVTTSPAGLEEYWQRLWARQPSSRAYVSRPARPLMGFYYHRLVLTVTPRRVSVPAPAPAAAAPPPQVTGDDAFAQAVRRLAAHPSAVLTALEDDGTPRLLRVAPGVDAARRRLLLPASVRLPGPASLLWHGHDAQLARLWSFQVTGVLDDEGVFAPRRALPGPESVTGLRALRELAGMRAAARAYVADRGLPPPVVPWEEYARLVAQVVADERAARPVRQPGRRAAGSPAAGPARR